MIIKLVNGRLAFDESPGGSSLAAGWQRGVNSATAPARGRGTARASGRQPGGVCPDRTPSIEAGEYAFWPGGKWNGHPRSRPMAGLTTLPPGPRATDVPSAV
jgi:hypothetical protein